MALLRQPLLHFLLIGALLFWLSNRGDAPLPSPDAAPVPATSSTAGLAAADESLLVQAALDRGWHLADPVARRRLLQLGRFVADDRPGANPMRMALNLDLHRNDLVVRRRLVQRMLQQAWAEAAAQAPDEAALRKLYESGDYSEPARIAFVHRFYSNARRDNPLADARAALGELAERDLVGAPPGGDPFLHGLQFGPLTRQQLIRLFGAAFAGDLFAQAETHGIQGPIASAYGHHLVQVTAYQPPKKQPFDAVRGELETAWRRNAEQRAVAGLVSSIQ